jgi:tetratricopeptide (TPR) repeat protein
MRQDDHKTRPVDGTFVGRSRELEELRAGFAAARSGRGGLWLVTGEAGIGKTRLATEFATHAAARGARVLWGRCREDRGAPAYWPWIQIIRTYARGCDPDVLGKQLGTGRAYVTQLVPELAEVVATTAPPQTLSEHARFYLFDATARFLRAAGRSQPLALILEDLHAADPASLLLLEFLAAELSDAPLFVLGTYREAEALVERDGASVLGALARSGHRLPLRGLSRSQVATMITDGFRLNPSEAVLAGVHEATGGNPFFVNEAVRLLAAEGRIQHLGPGGLGVPEGVRQTIRQRLAAMSQDGREVLSIAAVVGRDFSLAPLQRCCDLQAARIVALLEDAATQGLLAPIRIDLGSYRFAHALVREALYADLSAAQRLAFHRRVGDALEALYAGNIDAHIDEIAAHFLAAAPLGGIDDAIAYAVRAGRSALSNLAYEPAGDMFEQAVDLFDLHADADQIQRCELLLDLGEARMRAGFADAAKRRFREAAGVARSHALHDQLARAALGYGGQWTFTGETVDDTLVALLEEALGALGDADDAVRAQLLARLANELYHSDRPERAARHSERAVEAARASGDPTALGQALLARLYALWRPVGRENLDERARLDQQVLQLAERTGDRELELSGRAWRVIDLLESGDVTGADAQIAAFTRTATELRQPFYLWFVPVFGAMRALMDGRYSDAERLADEALVAGRRAQGKRELAENAVLVHLIQTLLLQRERGPGAAVAQASDEPAPVRRALEQFPRQAAWRGAVALRDLRLGREAEARGQFELLAADDFRALFTGEGSLIAIALASELCAALGDGVRADALYGHLLPYAGRHVLIGHPAMAYQGAVDLYLGLLAATTGDDRTAIRHLDDAHAMHARMGAAPWVARTRYQQARLLLTRRGAQDATSAATLLAAASRTAAELGMAPLAEQIRVLGHAAGPAPPPADTGVPTAGVFRRDGDYWTVALGGDVVRVKDVKGMGYLQRLLGDPAREFHVLDLATGDSRGTTTAKAAAADGLAVGGTGDAGALLDAQAKAAYRRRLRDLRADADEAEAMGDGERAARAQEEIDALAHELARAAGLGGRDRRAAAPAERARVNVSRAIRAAISRIAEHSPSLGHHLDSTVHTGTYCSYTPDPAAPPTWDR